MTDNAMLAEIRKDIKTLIGRDSNHEARLVTLERVWRWVGTVGGVIVAGIIINVWVIR